MALGILTPKGVETVKQEEAMLDYLAGKWGVKWIAVSKDNAASVARVDGFFVRGQVVQAVYESKCRVKWDGYDSLLITADKIENGATVSAILAVPFLVLLYVVPHGRVYCWRVTDSAGRVVLPMMRKRTETQATVNGGVANRENAFLKLENAMQYLVEVQHDRAQLNLST